MKNQVGKKFSNEMINALHRAAKLKIRLDMKGVNFLDEMSKSIENLSIEDILHLTEAIRVLDNCMDEIEATKL